MMSDVTDRWARVQTLFEQALDRPADERSAWLRTVCGDDPEVYREVQDLLGGDANQHTLFDGRVADLFAPAELDAALAPQPGERVGPWILGERIGTGGMGTVYRAERADDFEQTAALKRIKPGMDSEAVLARFRAERQILARLDHPGIARLLDGGLGPDGRPYFAMELVEGQPITDHCDRLGLSVDDRLALFERVCEAVAYAHRQLVVHRDLKPSNVYVTDPGRVKLLDFGIARVLSDDADDGLTQTGHRLLTPASAAPEQVRGEPPTTATDVYALGGLLYRLLCGAPPLDPSLSLLEVERAVLDHVPARPSTHVTAEAARLRSTTETALAKRLRGDLDTICLTALRKEPERRYGSAAELLADVRRHRADLPVEARPATTRYRLGRFVRRHRAGVLGTVAAVLAVVALASFYTVRLAAERDRAEAEAAKATEIAAFLGDVFRNADPSESKGDSVLVVDVLERGAARVRTELAGQPGLQAPLLRVIGSVYVELGRYAEADTVLAGALHALDGLADADPEELAQTLGVTALLRYYQNEFEVAGALYERALAVRREAFGPGDLRTATALVDLASHRYDTGEYSAADSLLQIALAVQRRQLPPDAPDLAHTYEMMGLIADVDGDAERFDALIQRALPIRETQFEPPHFQLAETLLLAGLAKRERDDYEVAEHYLLESLRQRRQLYGDAHQEVGYALNHLASLERDREDYEAAERYAREGLAVRRAVFGRDHVEVGASLGNVARIQEDRGDLEGALQTLREMRQILDATVGAEHPFAGAVAGRIGAIQEGLGRDREAEVAYRRSVAILRGAFPEGGGPLAWATYQLGAFLADRQPADAERLLLESARLCRAVPDPDPTCEARAREVLAGLRS